MTGLELMNHEHPGLRSIFYPKNMFTLKLLLELKTSKLLFVFCFCVSTHSPNSCLPWLIIIELLRRRRKTCSQAIAEKSVLQQKVASHYRAVAPKMQNLHQAFVQNVFWGVVTNPNGWHTVLGAPAGSKPPIWQTTPWSRVLSNADQIARAITTNVCVLEFQTMGATACFVGMQDRFSNKLCCRFLGKTIQN